MTVESGSNVLSVIILTRNEIVNLRHAIESALLVTPHIFVVDSFSDDGTRELARQLGATVVEHEFVTQAAQLNWAMDHLPIATPWTMRLDADERISSGLGAELLEALPRLPLLANGVEVKRQVYFMNRWIKHGGYYPTWLLRVWRTGNARCEDRWMDEHMVLTSGHVVRSRYDIVDWNLKGLHFWIQKHQGFAIREANDLLGVPPPCTGGGEVEPSLIGRQDMRKRWLKRQLYARSPLLLRSALYFGYRYFFRLGFLDGREGLIFHFLQGWWYRFLVDAIVYERSQADSLAAAAARKAR